MTKKAYHIDAYVTECDAKVLSIVGTKVELDNTIFYIQGGGQPSDTGTITRDHDVFVVSEVKNENGKVLHAVDREGLRVGDSVTCVVDWEKRYTHMRMHTSAHILAAILFKKYGALITGNQLGEEESRMDFNVKEFDRALLKGIEDEVNAELAKEHEIKVSSQSREEALKNPTLFRLKDVLPKDIPVLRIVAIGDCDIQADGGTHVRNTREVGEIEIFDLKNKGAENRRIYWRLR